MIGKTLIHYEVTSQLGKGGMGEVWRARDQKLGREVAIKTLPDEFSRDEQRLARFEREAKLLASLNHPNIAGIHGLEEDGGTHFLVLELVEGDTLAERLRDGALPVEESLELALQIAEALEAAHGQGVIHRDLKPANIKVTPEGKVKVLDFGLAKAFAGDASDPHPSHSPTLSMAATGQGMILGTAAYMSPEQAKGREVDRTTDVWAFGCVLYEMLTGRQAFGAPDVSEILAAVIRAEPKWEKLPGDLHPRLREILERCLQKQHGNRYHDIADVRLDIDRVLRDPDGPLIRPAAVVSGAQSKLPWVAALVLGVLGGVAGWVLKPAPPLALIRFDHELPTGQALQPSTRAVAVAFSPDGSRFLYNTIDGFYVRTLGSTDAILLSGTGLDLRNPVFSPDGQWIAYWSGGQINKIALTGGAPIALSNSQTPFGISWASDGTILFGTNAGIMRMSENGGPPDLIVELGGARVAGPQLLPGGEWVLFSEAGSESWDEGRIVVQSLESGERRVLVEGGSGGRYLPTGHLVYLFEGVLFAIAFDEDRLEVTGGPVPVVAGMDRATESGVAQFDVSDEGALAFIAGGAASVDRILSLVDRNGGLERLDVPPGRYLSPRLSPDGGRLAVQSSEPEGSVIWIFDLAGDSAIQRFTLEGNNYHPIWTPDGERITFSSDRDGTVGIYWKRADGSGVAERLTTAEEGVMHWPKTWSPDGNTLVFKIETNRTGTLANQNNEMDLWTVSLEADGTEVLFGEPFPALEVAAAFSPDGKWLAYSAGDGPAIDYDVFVEPFPATGERRRVSAEPGIMPVWSPLGDELFYRPLTQSGGQGQTLKGIRVSMDPTFTFSAEQPVPIGQVISFPFYRSFDVMPDGDRFVVVLPDEEQDSGETVRPRIHVVLNWFQELKERVPVP